MLESRKAWPLLSIISAVAVAFLLFASLIGCKIQPDDPASSSSGLEGDDWGKGGGLFSGEKGGFTYELKL